MYNVYVKRLLLAKDKVQLGDGGGINSEHITTDSGTL